MTKKFLILSTIAIFTLAFINFAYATDVVMDLNSTIDTSNRTANTSNTVDNTITSTDNNINNATDNLAVDNTIYSSSTNDVAPTSSDIQEPTVTTTTDYEDSGDLSITNMINIILIVVGVVLILLGIAIIIRLK